MGLELAELSMEIEDHFDIEIPEDEENIYTVGELVDFIDRQINGRNERRCYSSFCFYRLRKAIM